MRYCNDTNINLHKTCVAFGNFDGVHLGHRAIINKLLDVSKQGLTSVVLSFEYDESLSNKAKILSTKEEKQYLIKEINPDVMISYKIDSQKENFTIESFIKEILIDKLDANVVVTSKGDPNIEILRKYSEKYSFTLEECDIVTFEGESVTSERIINELENGTLQRANEMLGHAYLIMGRVMHGKALGRTVGMPTANLGFSDNKQLPSYGVYGTLSEIDDRNVKGLTNIGKRPSVDNYNYVTIETFLLDFSGDLYDKTIALEVHAYIRGVKKFNNLDEVKSQVDKDIKLIRAYLDEVCCN